MNDMTPESAAQEPPAAIETFDDLVAAAAAEPEPSKLLVVLVGVEPVHYRQPDGTTAPAENEGSLTPMMVRDLLVTPELSLDEVVAAADETRQPWQFLMLAVLAGSDGRAPGRDECDTHLKRMAKAILTGGDLSRFACFDRDGQPIYIQNPLI